jgi:hypothetical protein
MRYHAHDKERYDATRHKTRYDAIRIETKRNETIKYKTIRHHVVPHNATQHDTIRYDTIRHNTTQCDTTRHDRTNSTVQRPECGRRLHDSPRHHRCSNQRRDVHLLQLRTVTELVRSHSPPFSCFLFSSLSSPLFLSSLPNLLLNALSSLLSPLSL